MWIESVGTLHASEEGGVYRLALDVDPGIVELARALVPRYVPLQKQRYAPHISVIREHELLPGFFAHDGREIPFVYDPEVVVGDKYYWLRAESPTLRALRTSFGLPPLVWYNRPPDDQDHWHITIGNLGKGKLQLDAQLLGLFGKDGLGRQVAFHPAAKTTGRAAAFGGQKPDVLDALGVVGLEFADLTAKQIDADGAGKEGLEGHGHSRGEGAGVTILKHLGQSPRW